ncbi:benzoate/H(+) symporter BenE family transporter [Pseudovibrio flavus]|uniref:benzoate/H(+) symporter BenE family transporter n=1 Tax=Pseudovibrio flavus TaxID=2529854 RepID=UPI00211B90C2|nr:benzoate/H(+) symporter BenE family transporter [Pseudovibrio flavus]
MSIQEGKFVDTDPKKRNLLKDINAENVSAGILAAIFGCVATSFIIINSGTEAGMSDAFVSSWLTSVWFFGGILGVFLAYTTKQPIAGAWSIPVGVMMAQTLQLYPVEQAIGAYLVAGFIVLGLGLSGLINRIIKFIPEPVIMAMIAGALMRFGTGVISGVEALPIISGITVIAYFIAMKLVKKISPIIPAFIIGMILSFALGYSNIENFDATYLGLQFMAPEFNIGAIIAISIPIAILVVGAENAQATGVLMSEGYNVPVKKMTIWSGIGGIVTSTFGGPNANIAGPMTAISASDTSGPEKEKRYVAAIVCGVICLTFGWFSSYAINFLKLVPVSLIMTIAGLAMVNVLLSSLQAAFQKTQAFQIAAFFAFIIALSGVSFLGITAPFWSLVGGVAIAFATDMKAFKERLAA